MYTYICIYITFVNTLQSVNYKYILAMPPLLSFVQICSVLDMITCPSKNNVYLFFFKAYQDLPIVFLIMVKLKVLII